MYGVELYAAVRLAVVDEGLSHHEADRRFGIDRRTVKKMLSYSSPPGYHRTAPVRRPKLDGFTGIVDAILEADQAEPRKQRHTPQRRCQTNWIGPIEASIEGSQAASWRHSARAAVRCCLKTSRRVRWRWWLKWLWIEAWTAANFCRVLMSLNRAIAPSGLRNG